MSANDNKSPSKHGETVEREAPNTKPASEPKDIDVSSVQLPRSKKRKFAVLQLTRSSIIQLINGRTGRDDAGNKVWLVPQISIRPDGAKNFMIDLDNPDSTVVLTHGFGIENLTLEHKNLIYRELIRLGATAVAPEDEEYSRKEKELRKKYAEQIARLRQERKQVNSLATKEALNSATKDE